MGPGTWKGGRRAQIALRFPVHDKARPAKEIPYHIDGISTDNNGLKEGKLNPFTLLVGIFLKNIPKKDR